MKSECGMVLVMGDIAISSEFDFVKELPKREKSRYAKFRERYAAYKGFIDENGMVVMIPVAAKLAGVCNQRVRDLVEEGRLKTVNFEGHDYVTEDSLVEFMSSERKSGRPSKYVQDAEKKGPFRAAVGLVKDLMK